MKNEGLDKLKNEAVNALVRWGKIGLGLYSMRDAVNAYMKACGADKIPFDGINGIREKRKIVMSNPKKKNVIQNTELFEKHLYYKKKDSKGDST